MEGRRLLTVEARRADLRFPFPENFAARLLGARIVRMGRRAKYLAAELDTASEGGLLLVMHLGMTGRFTIGRQMLGEFHHDAGPSDKHEHVVFGLDDGGRVGYSDPRRFGFMDLWPLADVENYPAFKAMGPEPLSNRFSGAWLREAFRGRRTPIKSALLDQTMVAGLGNIYVCEALWRAGISPERLAGSISAAKSEALAASIREVIAEAIEAGGSSISDFAAADGSLGYFQHRFSVYDREGDPCQRCGKAVERLVQSGRSTFHCGSCQR